MKRAFLFIAVLMLISCDNLTTSSPIIIDFSAEAYVIAPGTQTVLHWDVFDATSVRIDSGTISIGDVPLKGAATVSPSVSTWYRISASKKSSLIQRTLNITVK